MAIKSDKITTLLHKTKNKAAVQTFTSRRNFDKTNNGEFDANVAANNFAKVYLAQLQQSLNIQLQQLGL